MTGRGQLATEEQRKEMQLLVERFEELKVEDQPYKDENMVGDSFFCSFGSAFSARVLMPSHEVTLTVGLWRSRGLVVCTTARSPSSWAAQLAVYIASAIQCEEAAVLR